MSVLTPGATPQGLPWPRMTRAEELRLQIAGRYFREGWFEPLVWDTDNKGRHIIHTGGEYDSYLQVPVIPARYQTKSGLDLPGICQTYCMTATCQANAGSTQGWTKRWPARSVWCRNAPAEAYRRSCRSRSLAIAMRS